jgi:glycosyltransferase involved in cell wall biosynthesis
MSIRHSVIVVTYNHEKYICFALDSIFTNQSILPDEVIIGDDCSTDNTWEIIQSYSKKYLQIKAIRNNTNLGGFGNLNNLTKYITGDIISYLSGDDLFKANIFENFNKAIKEYKINVKKERFIIITNSVHLYPSGKETIYDNFQLRNSNLFKARLRYGLSFRSVGISYNTIIQCNPIKENIGVFADWLWGFEKLINTDKFVFLNVTGAVYRLGVGLTSKTKDIEFAISKKSTLQIIENEYKEIFDKKDKFYIQYLNAQTNFIIHRNIKAYFVFLYHYLVNINNFTPNNSWKKNLPNLFPKYLLKCYKIIRNSLNK